jgi:hypothetical protein
MPKVHVVVEESTVALQHVSGERWVHPVEAKEVPLHDKVEEERKHHDNQDQGPAQASQ